MKYENINFKPPLAVRKAAEKGLILRKKFKRGGLASRVAGKLGIGSAVKITLPVSTDHKISFQGVVVRVEGLKEYKQEYVLGLKIEAIDEGDQKALDKFLQKINIATYLDNIDYEGVMDIYLNVGYPPVLKKIDEWSRGSEEPFDEHGLKCLLYNMLDEDRYKKFKAQKELNYVYEHSQDKRFRVNLHLQRGRVEGVLRLLPSKVQLPEELGLPTSIEGLLNNENGLILVAGRTGAGKTTSMASMVEAINRKREGIVVCIEYVVSNSFLCHAFFSGRSLWWTKWFWRFFGRRR